jgi:amidase
MAMSSAGCALLLEVLAGYDDGRDPRQFAGLQAKPYVSALTQGVQGLRIGIVQEGFGTAGAQADVDAMVRTQALRLREAGAVVEEVSIPMHLQGPAIMFSSIMDNTLSTFTDQGASGPNVRGHFPLGAIEFYGRARRERADDYPVTVKTVMLFGLAMRRRYGHYYSAKAHNLVPLLRAAYDDAMRQFDILVMPTTR